MGKPQVCAVCGIPWEDGVGFVGEHIAPCANNRYLCAFTVDRYKDATLELSSRGIDRSVPGEPMSKEDIRRRRLEGLEMYEANQWYKALGEHNYRVLTGPRFDSIGHANRVPD